MKRLISHVRLLWNIQFVHLFSNTFETARYNMIIHVILFLVTIHVVLCIHNKFTSIYKVDVKSCVQQVTFLVSAMIIIIIAYAPAELISYLFTELSRSAHKGLRDIKVFGTYSIRYNWKSPVYSPWQPATYFFFPSKRGIILPAPQGNATCQRSLRSFFFFFFLHGAFYRGTL